MKAVVWHGKHDVRCEEVPDPKLINPRDAIVRVTTTAICGSDLHLYDGFMQGMKSGDVLGHEFMGIVEEVGPGVGNLKKGDRVIVPFAIACGDCWFCKHDLWSACDNSNPNAGQVENAYGQAGAGLFGYSHLMGGYDGGQAQFVRVPYADVGPVKIPDHLEDEQVLFLTDVFPTGWQAAVNAEIKPGDVVAIWGGGAVGQFAAISAREMGADRVIMIDREPERLLMAARNAGAEMLNFEQAEPDVVEALKAMTAGRGPDACIDCVGLEAVGHGTGAVVDWALNLARLQTDRPNALRQAIQACRKAGHVSVPGVYAGLLNNFNFGSAFGKGLTLKMGQTHVHAHVPKLLSLIESGVVDPRFVITHRGALEDAPQLYENLKLKRNGAIKAVLKPFEAPVPAVERAERAFLA